MQFERARECYLRFIEYLYPNRRRRRRTKYNIRKVIFEIYQTGNMNLI